MRDDKGRAAARVAAASYDERFLRICQSYLASQSEPCRCDLYRAGGELLRALRGGLGYQALLLDTALDDMDAGGLCRRIMELEPGCRPRLILLTVRGLTGFQPPGGAGVYPLDLASLKSLLLELQASRGAPPQPAAALRRRLAAWGGTTGRNCSYLIEAVALAARSEEPLAIRKDILQQVGDHYSISVTAVDSGIRRLIRCLDAAGRPGWQDFKQRHSPRAGAFTTGSLICALRDELLYPAGPDTSPEGDPYRDERETQPV